MFFSNAKRPEIVRSNPDASFGTVAKIVGREFQALTQEEKQVFLERAACDKERYIEEMKMYVAPPAYAVENGGMCSSEGRKRKDPNAPKKGLSAYNFFFQDVRPSVLEEHPDATFAEISKIIGSRFRELTPESKQPYNDLAAEDKLRYNREMLEYNQTAAVPVTKKQPKDPNAPKRNLSSYMIFAQEHRAEIKEQNPGCTFGELNKLLGHSYQNLSAEQKEAYQEKARDSKARYEIEFQQYQQSKQLHSDMHIPTAAVAFSEEELEVESGSDEDVNVQDIGIDEECDLKDDASDHEESELSVDEESDDDESD